MRRAERHRVLTLRVTKTYTGPAVDRAEDYSVIFVKGNNRLLQEDSSCPPTVRALFQVRVLFALVLLLLREKLTLWN
jgi:hypothetical protein